MLRYARLACQLSADVHPALVPDHVWGLALVASWSFFDPCQVDGHNQVAWLHHLQSQTNTQALGFVDYPIIAFALCKLSIPLAGLDMRAPGAWKRLLTRRNPDFVFPGGVDSCFLTLFENWVAQHGPLSNDFSCMRVWLPVAEVLLRGEWKVNLCVATAAYTESTHTAPFCKVATRSQASSQKLLFNVVLQ